MSVRSGVLRLALVLAFGCLVVQASGASKPTAGLLSEAGPTFRIAAPAGAWSLIAYGDMRFTDPRNTTDTNPVARRALVARVAEEKPDALLLSGDVPLNGGWPTTMRCIARRRRRGGRQG